MKKNLQTKFSYRQHMISKDFEIYYYNDMHFSHVDIHSHNYYELYFFLEGDVSMLIDTTSYHLKSGDVILIPPYVPHQAVIFNSATPYRRFVFWISKAYYEQLLYLSDCYSYILEQAKKNRYIFHFDTINFHSIQARIFALIEENHSERFGKNEMIKLHINDLMLYLNRKIYEHDHPETPQEKQTLYESLLYYIEGHLEEDLTLDRLADNFYVSKYHIAHIFKENLGLSIHQYITKKRLAFCRDSILSGIDISKAYLMYGFKDYSSFFRAFRKEYGLSPKEYKEFHSMNMESN